MPCLAFSRSSSNKLFSLFKEYFFTNFYLGKLGDRYLANLSKKEIYWHGLVTGAPGKCLTPSCAGQNDLIYNIYLFPAYKVSHTMALEIC